MTDSHGGRAVDAHLGEEGGEVAGLDFAALLTGETRGTKGVLNHHAPDGSEANLDMFTAEGSVLDALGNVVGLGEAMLEFVDVVAIGCETDAEGALADGGADALDRLGIVEVGSGGE